MLSVQNLPLTVLCAHTPLPDILARLVHPGVNIRVTAVVQGTGSPVGRNAVYVRSGTPLPKSIVIDGVYDITIGSTGDHPLGALGNGGLG